MTVAVDGRVLRRERNRELVIDAMLDLLVEGVARPTAQDVADRSGVSLRSIFRIFEDVDTLHAEAAVRQHERTKHLFVEVPPTGPLPDRIHAVVAVHSRIYEHIAPVRRVAVRMAATSQPLADYLERSRRWFRDEVARVFAAEAAEAAEADEARDTDAAELLAAVERALSWEAWNQLRSAQDLSAARARRAVHRTVTALLRC